MIYYVYFLFKGYRNYLYKVSTQFCSFERGVYLYFSIKVYFAMLLYILICCKWFVCFVILYTECEGMNK